MLTKEHEGFLNEIAYKGSERFTKEELSANFIVIINRLKYELSIALAEKATLEEKVHGHELYAVDANKYINELIDRERAALSSNERMRKALEEIVLICK